MDSPVDAMGQLECEVLAIPGDDRKAVVAGFAMGIFLPILAVIAFFTTSPKDPMVHLVMPAGACLLGFVFLATGVYKKLTNGTHVRVFSDRLTCVDRSGALEIRWEDVYGIRESTVKVVINGPQGMHSHTDQFVTLLDREGAEIKFGGKPTDIRRVVNAVVAHAYEYIAPRLEKELADGAVVDLGSVRVSSAGLETSKGKLAWHEIGRVEVSEGRLEIWLPNAETWLSTPLHALVNYRVLFAWLDRHTGRNAGAPQW